MNTEAKQTNEALITLSDIKDKIVAILVEKKIMSSLDKKSREEADGSGAPIEPINVLTYFDSGLIVLKIKGDQFDEIQTTVRETIKENGWKVDNVGDDKKESERKKMGYSIIKCSPSEN